MGKLLPPFPCTFPELLVYDDGLTRGTDIVQAMESEPKRDSTVERLVMEAVRVRNRLCGVDRSAVNYPTVMRFDAAYQDWLREHPEQEDERIWSR